MRDTDERPCYTYRASPDIVGGWTQAVVRGNGECPGSEKDLVCWKKPGQPEVFKPTKDTLLRKFWELLCQLVSRVVQEAAHQQ